MGKSNPSLPTRLLRQYLFYLRPSSCMQQSNQSAVFLPKSDIFDLLLSDFKGQRLFRFGQWDILHPYDLSLPLDDRP